MGKMVNGEYVETDEELYDRVYRKPFLDKAKEAAGIHDHVDVALDPGRGIIMLEFADMVHDKFGEPSIVITNAWIISPYVDGGMTTIAVKVAGDIMNFEEAFKKYASASIDEENALAFSCGWTDDFDTCEKYHNGIASLVKGDISEEEAKRRFAPLRILWDEK